MSIPEYFFSAAKTYSQKTALLYKKEGVFFPITYKELSEKITAMGSGLRRLGVGKKDLVAILSENRPEWVIADIGAMSIGATTVPLHTTFNPQTLYKILNHSRAKVLVVSSGALLNKILLHAKKLKHLQKIIFLDTLTAPQKKVLGDKVISFKKAVSGQHFPVHASEIPAIHPDDCCSIIYTSGATGEPKGVMLTHRNFLSNIAAMNTLIPVEQTDVFLSFLPLSHVLERTGGYLMPLFFGATIAYAEGIKHLPQNLKEVRPTILISVPRVFDKFHDAIWDKVNASSPLQKKLFLWAIKQKRRTLSYAIADRLVFKKIKNQFGGNLRLAISGGASLDGNICKFFFKIGILILEGYGLTETSPVISVNTVGDNKFGTVGKVIPGVEVKISEQKEILVNGPNVALGYFKNDKEWRASFNGGWFHTGDLGFLDSLGFLTIIGRKKEMIVLSNGKKIWPEPIENLLINDKYITQAMVVGNGQRFTSALLVPDWREITVFLKKSGLALQNHQELIKNPVIKDLIQRRLDQKINPHLSDVEKIKKFVLLAQEFSQEHGELTPTLKLRRHIISDHYQKAIASLYA